MPDPVIKLTRMRQKIGNDVTVVYPKTTDAQVIVGNSTLAAKLTAMDTATTTAITTANAYTDSKIEDVVGGAPSTLNTLKALADAIGSNASYYQAINDALDTKSDTTHDHDTVYLKLIGGTVTGQISTPTDTTYAALAAADTVNKGQFEAKLDDYALTTDVRQTYATTTQPTLNEGDLWLQLEEA